METLVRTPMQIFTMPQHLVIPLFQRAYVWGEEHQWEPLWQDIRRLVDVNMGDPRSSVTHFLGAVVVQQHETPLGHLTVSNVIDGQQRLTTLQLLMDAAGGVLDEVGADVLAGQLESLTHNQEIYVEPGGSRLKIRQTNKDGAAFEAVMNAERPVDHDGLGKAKSLVVQAHAYFTQVVRTWLGEAGSDGFADRASTLVRVLTSGLQLVTINLTAAENSQEIFETLNARGTPLTAADLIKNYVFQRLEIEGADTKKAYATQWPFETKFWETEVSAGRYSITRSSLFLNQWLISRTGEPLGPQATFRRFKAWVEHAAHRPMSEILPLLKSQADLYEKWTIAAQSPDKALDRVELCVYRMAQNETELLKPVLIWLHTPERPLPPSAVQSVIAATESWVMRRLLLRLPGSDLGRVVAEIIRTYREAPAEDLASRVTAHLSRLNVSSTYWPGDDEVRESLLSEAAYTRFRRGRLRCVLEAIEDTYRAETGQHQVSRSGYPIEHLLPQKWQDAWHVATYEEEADRAAHVHRLGNLTLLTTGLNSKVSNGAWHAKRAALLRHDTLLLNSRLIAAVGDAPWNEATIDARTRALVDVMLRVWPVPMGHQGAVLDPESKPAAWVEIKDLIAAGLLAPGTVVTARPGSWGYRVAAIREGGLIEVDDKRFTTPSAAGAYVRGGSTNGWLFWRLEDGRQLNDVRAAFTGNPPDSVDRRAGRTERPDRYDREQPRFDWEPMHRILAKIPSGYWTTYGQLASAVGTSPQPLGQHITRCRSCPNAHRVLKSDGTIAPGFTWSDKADSRDPRAVLEAEGIVFKDGVADGARRQDTTALRALASESES